MDMNAFWANGVLTVTWDTPYSVQERQPDSDVVVRVIEEGQGPVTKDLPIDLTDPANEIDVVVP